MNIEQKIDALITAVANLTDAVSKLSTPAAPAVDLTPVLTAIQAVSDKIDAQVGADSTGGV